MRIAYILADHGIPVFGNKGASVHVRDFSQALCDLGHEVELFCAKHGPDPQATPYQLHKVSVPPQADDLVDDSDPLGYRRAKEKRYQATALRMQQVITERHQQAAFDAIYERYSLWSAAGVRLAEQLQLPTVVEVNAPLLLEQLAYRELALEDQAKAIEYEVFSKANALVTVSREVAQYVTSKGASAEQVHVLPNGVDHRRFNPRRTPAQLPEAEGRLVIAFAGSLKAWHGVEILFDAFRELTQRLAGLHLLVIGDGPLGEWLKGYAAGAQLEHKITFTGWQDHDQVAALLARADLTVAPYPQLEDFYFSPLKIFEYLALGKPVVASNIGQIPELVRHGCTGLLVSPGDPLALANALETLAVDPALRKRMGVTAAADAENHTWLGNARRVENLFQQHQLTKPQAQP